ncbi:MAG: TIGR02186 family protein [Rhodobacteraceae bacterium]|nr:TIGR02186 family protein [Paracoccaceae bacterium]
MLRILSFLLAFSASAISAQETVIVGLSQSNVAITANFSGSDILVFGAVKRTGELPVDASPLDVIIVVEGPLQQVTVRRKEKKLGIWVNTDSVDIDAAPSFFTVATTAPLDDILPEELQREHAIGLEYAVRLPEQDLDPETESFNEAIARIRVANGLYSEREGAVNFSADTLFDTDIELPANLIEGDYTTKIFLIRDQQIIGQTSVQISVRKTGIERWIYNLAHEQALLYGLLSLLVALVAGYGASEIFRRLKG